MVDTAAQGSAAVDKNTSNFNTADNINHLPQQSQELESQRNCLSESQTELPTQTDSCEQVDSYPPDFDSRELVPLFGAEDGQDLDQAEGGVRLRHRHQSPGLADSGVFEESIARIQHNPKRNSRDVGSITGQWNSFHFYIP